MILTDQQTPGEIIPHLPPFLKGVLVIAILIGGYFSVGYANDMGISLSAGWGSKATFVPVIFRIVDQPNVWNIGALNKRDFWYKVKIIRNNQEITPWGEWSILPPWTEIKFPYQAASGDQVIIIVSNELFKDRKITFFWATDFIARILLGESITSPFEATLEDINFLIDEVLGECAGLGFGIVKSLTLKELRGIAIKIAGCILSVRLVKEGLIRVLERAGLQVAAQIAAKASLVLTAFSLAANVGAWWNLANDTVKSFRDPPSEQVTVSFISKTISPTFPDLRVIRGLRIMNRPPYTVGQTLTATFSIVNRGTKPATVEVLTVGGRGPRGADDVRDFQHHTNITIPAGRTYTYRGQLILLEPGNYHFFIAYRIGDGFWNTSVPTEGAAANTLDIVVLPNNRPPIANAGPDQTVQVGSTVQLDGSGSSDPDGDEIKSYQWTILPRENSARCIFRTSNRIVNPKVQPRREGSCTIELQVTDARGARSVVPDQVRITARKEICKFKHEIFWIGQPPGEVSQTIIDPSIAPTNASVRFSLCIEETPASFRWVYTIYNLDFRTQQGINGLSGIRIENTFRVPFSNQFGPPGWVMQGFVDEWEWDIPSGQGILQGASAQFGFETAKNVQPTVSECCHWVHSWDSTPVQVDILSGGQMIIPNLITSASLQIHSKFEATLISVGNSFKLTVTKPDTNVKDLSIAVFRLDGRLVFRTDWIQNGFIWYGQDMQGRPLANGVYLYVVRVRGFDGREYVSEVRKLVIVR